jgi:hypothetical protein
MTKSKITLAVDENRVLFVDSSGNDIYSIRKSDLPEIRDKVYSDKPISSKLEIGQLNKSVLAEITSLVSQKGVRNTPERPNAVVPVVETRELNLQNDYVFKPKSLTIIRIKNR